MLYPRFDSDVATPHRSGGRPPPLPNGRGRVFCNNCDTPLHTILRLDLTDPALLKVLPQAAADPLRVAAPASTAAAADGAEPELPKRLAELPILTCLNCDGYREPLRYRVRLDGRVQVLRQGDGTSFHDFPVELPERAVDLSAAPYPPSADVDAMAAPLHQIGGEPFWIDEEAVPRCSECRSPMTFVGQIDSDPAQLMRFGDNGLLYAFCCFPCGEVVTFAQWT